MTTSDQFRTRLAALGLTQRGFARLLAELAGRPPVYRTIEKWGAERDPPPWAWALLALLERHPEDAVVSTPIGRGLSFRDGALTADDRPVVVKSSATRSRR
jgi:hypothetical protein